MKRLLCMGSARTTPIRSWPGAGSCVRRHSAMAWCVHVMVLACCGIVLVACGRRSQGSAADRSAIDRLRPKPIRCIGECVGWYGRVVDVQAVDLPYQFSAHVQLYALTVEVLPQEDDVVSIHGSGPAQVEVDPGSDPVRSQPAFGGFSPMNPDMFHPGQRLSLSHYESFDGREVEVGDIICLSLRVEGLVQPAMTSTD